MLGFSRSAALVAAASALRASAAVIIGNQTVEYLTNPLGIDIDWNPSPRFGWQVQGAQQASYRLWVSTDPGFSSAVCDSGTVASSASAQIAPCKPGALSYDTDYYWLVQLSMSGGGSAVNSSVATFTTALNGSAWASNGVWVGGFEQMRYSFTLAQQPITRARLYVTGVGIFTLYVNGQPVSAVDVLSPGWSTVPEARVLSLAYDVASMLRPGQENVLGMRLGMGKYGYLGDYCDAGPAACYAGLLQLNIASTGAGGSTNASSITTNTGWTGTVSPIVFNHLFDGETFNASLDQPGWSAPGFVPPPGAAAWDPVTVLPPPTAIVSSWGTPIRIQGSKPAQGMYALNTSNPTLVGLFVKSTTSQDIWWVDPKNTSKHHVDVCQPCASVPACSLFVTVPQSFIDGLPTAANFTCAMLPGANVTTYIFDLGRNMAGMCTVTLPPATTASGAVIVPPGTTVSLLHAEITVADGGAVDNTYGTNGPQRSCDPGAFNCADQLDQYIYSGGEGAAPFTYTPSFTFHGFRWVAVFGWPAAAAPPTAASLTCHQAYSALQQSGGVAFNNSVLNAVQAAVVQTQINNMYSHPSDCPTRERRGWLGDSQVTVDEAMYNLNAAGFYENWLRSFSDSLFLGCVNPSSGSRIGSGPATDALDVAATGTAGAAPQRPPTWICCGDQSSFGCQPGLTPMNATGSLPDVIPYERKPLGAWPGDWTWQVAGEVIPATLLRRVGNAPALAALYPYISAHMSFANSAAGSNGLLQSLSYYNDWLAEEPAPALFVENTYYVAGALHAAAIAAAVGQNQDAVAYTALAASVSGAMFTAFFNTSAGYWGPAANMNTQAMALSWGLGGNATAPYAASIVSAMVNDCLGHQNHTTGGVGSARWILQGLELGNASAVALTMASANTQPSLGYMVSSPDMPGTIWEEWTGDAHHSDGSKCHPMLTGGFGAWAYESGVGLRFAYRPAAAAAAAVAGVDVNAECVASLGLDFDPRIRIGLSDADLSAVCAILASQRAAAAAGHAGAKVDVHEAKAAAAAAGVVNGVPAALQPVLVAGPDAAVVRGLGSAAGHYDTPQGRAAVSWSYEATATAAAFTLQAAVPSGVLGKLAVPLGIVRELQQLQQASASAAASASAGGALRLRVTANRNTPGAPEATLLQGTLHTVVQDAAKCEVLGGIEEGEALYLCNVERGSEEEATGQAQGQAQEVEGDGPSIHRMATASRPAVEGEGRMHWMHHPADYVPWASGALLLETGYGAFTVSVQA